MSEHAAELRRAVKDCRDRGLFTAAKWAAVQLAGLPRNGVPGSSVYMDATGGGEATDDTYELARTLFDLKVRSDRSPQFFQSPHQPNPPASYRTTEPWRTC
jgi:hypothetical protein